MTEEAYAAFLERRSVSMRRAAMRGRCTDRARSPAHHATAGLPTRHAITSARCVLLLLGGGCCVAPAACSKTVLGRGMQSRWPVATGHGGRLLPVTVSGLLR